MIKNITVNFLSRIFNTFSNFLFIPLYIHFLGIKGYSIISFSFVLAGIMSLLDAGLTVTLSRELASKKNDIDLKKRILTTLESCYIIIAGVIIVIFLLFSDFIAISWLNVENVSSDTISNYLKIIGTGVAFQLLTTFYMGGLYGLEKHIKANIYQIVFGIIRNGFVIIPLLFSQSLYWFFTWQTFCSIIFVILLRGSLKTLIFDWEVAPFFKIEKSVIQKTWKFAGGVLLIAIVAAVNTQMDKVAISNFLPIENLGYYTLAISMTQGLIILVNPVAIATLPRFTSLYSENKIKEATELFRRIFLLSSILVFSFSSNLIINGEDLIWIWTGSKEYALQVAPLLPYLTIGTAMLSLQYIPYNVAIANGQTNFINLLGGVSLIITLPGYWIMTKLYGSIGAAIVWGFVQCLITPFYLYYVNNKFLKGISINIIVFKQIFLPFFASLILSYLFSELKFLKDYRWGMLFWIGISTICTISFLAIVMIEKRELNKLLRFIYIINPFRDKHKVENKIG